MDKLYFEQVKGIGTFDIQLQSNQRVYTFIGENGVGKTKLLECLFTYLLLSNQQIIACENHISLSTLPFGAANINGHFVNISAPNGFDVITTQDLHTIFTSLHSHPVVYLSAQQRGTINEKPYQFERGNISKLGGESDRRQRYFDYLLSGFYGNAQGQHLKNINMNTDIEEWIVQRALSSNRYQAKEDNREIEIKTMLSLLHKIDQRFDQNFLEISGDNRVFLKVDGHKRDLSELSSGFTSLLKIIQSIVAGYSYFTNETQIDQVHGIVLIDEIESHLHNKWQVSIIAILKRLFPNTKFIITTHSSLIISQLNHGEAYRLYRDSEPGTVRAKLIDHPSKVSFIDLLEDAFGIDLNQLKINKAQKEGQDKAKQTLLALVQKELDELEMGQ